MATNPKSYAVSPMTCADGNADSTHMRGSTRNLREVYIGLPPFKNVHLIVLDIDISGGGVFYIEYIPFAGKIQ